MRRVSAFIARRDWFFWETKEKQGGSSSDTEDPSILAVFIPPSSTRPPDAMIDIILPSLWLQHVSFPTSVLSVLYLSCLLPCWLCPRRTAGIKRLWKRKDMCDQKCRDAEPLNWSVCHTLLLLQALGRLQRQNCSCDLKDHASCSPPTRGKKWM